jgi:hypothetical protein
MGSSDADSEYIGKAAAAKILDVSVPTVRQLVQQGVLIPHELLRKGKKGRPWEVFRLSDVQHLRLSRNEGQTDFRQVKSLALQALSAARRTERRLTEFAARLGLDIQPLPRTENYVEQLYETTGQEVHPNIVTQAWWLKFWSGTFFGIDEVYLELVVHVTGDNEPWRRFFDFSSHVTRLIYLQGDAVPVHPKRVFEASREHLRYVGYMYCRQSQSAKVAGLVFDRRASAVDELSALLS